jgi:hypothetical protein
MAVSLVEALREAKLEVGRIYRYDVDGRRVEVRVLEAPPPEPSPIGVEESDIMMDAWTEFPEPEGGVVLQSRLGEPDPPDILEIPIDEEGRMIEPLTAFVPPCPAGSVIARLAPPPPPDIPDIPAD